MSNPVILIVDDIEDNRLSLADWLEEDYECRMAADVPEARLRLAKGLPALILLDLSLPGVSGWDFAQELRADPRTEHLPIVAISAYARAEDRERALQAGCNDYLAKPYRMRELFAIIERILA